MTGMINPIDDSLSLELSVLRVENGTLFPPQLITEWYLGYHSVLIMSSKFRIPEKNEFIDNSQPLGTHKLTETIV